ncbi:hypothetical protein [Paraburkholderia terrae]
MIALTVAGKVDDIPSRTVVLVTWAAKDNALGEKVVPSATGGQLTARINGP